MSASSTRLSALVLGVATGVTVGCLTARPRNPELSFAQLDVWQRELARTRGTFEAARLAGLIRARYAELFERRPRFTHRALRAHLEGRILPALALYQTLRAESSPEQAAIDETLQIIRASIEPKRRLLARLANVPNAFGLFRLVAKPLMRLGFPEEGWHVEWVEDSDRCLAMNIRDRCPYRDTFTAFGSPELAAPYCTLDDWLYAALPPSIRYQRTTTLAQGGDRCDFRYCRGC